MKKTGEWSSEAVSPVPEQLGGQDLWLSTDPGLSSRPLPRPVGPACQPPSQDSGLTPPGAQSPLPADCAGGVIKA